MRFTLLLPLMLFAAGCGEQTDTPGQARIVPTDTNIEFAKTAQMEDERLNRIYQRSCRNCHAVAGVNAPLTGHDEAWASRLAERGRMGLLNSTKNGYRYMPARGLCQNCSDEDYLALIDFMMRVPDA